MVFCKEPETNIFSFVGHEATHSASEAQMQPQAMCKQRSLACSWAFPPDLPQRAKVCCRRLPVDSQPWLPAQVAWAPWRDRTHHCRGTPPPQGTRPAPDPQGTLLPQPLPAAGGAGRVLLLHISAEMSPCHPHRAPGPCRAHSRVALPGQGVALQAGAHGDVGEGVAAATALDGDAGGLSTDPRGGNDDAGDLHQV